MTCHEPHAPPHRGLPRADADRQRDARGRAAAHLAADREPRARAAGAGDADAALRPRARPAAADAPPGTTLLPLLQADEVAVLPAGHPLLAKRVLRPQDFAGQPFISLAPDDAYRQQLDALFAQHRVERVQALEAGSAAAVCALVRQGLGLAIVNPLTALELAGPALHVRRISVRIPFHVSLACPQLRPPSPLREAFVGALREAATAVRTRLRETTVTS